MGPNIYENFEQCKEKIFILAPALPPGSGVPLVRPSQDFCIPLSIRLDLRFSILMTLIRGWLKDKLLIPTANLPNLNFRR